MAAGVSLGQALNRKNVVHVAQITLSSALGVSWVQKNWRGSMSTRNSVLPAAVHEYLLSVSLREAPVLARLRAATAPRAEAEMQIGAEQGQFLALLVRLIGARRCIGS